MIAAIRALLIGVLGNSAIRGLALKYFFKGLIMFFLPVAIFAGFNMILNQLIQYIQSELSNVNPGQSMTVTAMTGLAAYLYVQLGLNTGLSALVSAFAIRFTLRAIPFLRL